VKVVLLSCKAVSSDALAYRLPHAHYDPSAAGITQAQSLADAASGGSSGDSGSGTPTYPTRPTGAASTDTDKDLDVWYQTLAGVSPFTSKLSEEQSVSLLTGCANANANTSAKAGAVGDAGSIACYNPAINTVPADAPLAIRAGQTSATTTICQAGLNEIQIYRAKASPRDVGTATAKDSLEALLFMGNTLNTNAAGCRVSPAAFSAGTWACVASLAAFSAAVTVAVQAAA
jgi:hypothetical protein